MACGKTNSNGDNIRSYCDSHLSKDLTDSDPIFSWAPSQAMCTSYRMNCNEAMQQQVRGSHAKGMPDMPRGTCEDNIQYSMHTSKEALFCTEWEHLHSLDQEKGRIATDGNILLKKDDLDPHANPDQLEDYVNELVPALHMVNKSTHNMDIAHRKEAIKLTADALLVRRATGMAWSNALSTRVSNYCNKTHVSAHTHHQDTEISLDLAKIAVEDPDYVASMECASSSCIRTPVSSEGTNSFEFSDHDFTAFHHGSKASLASSDHSSMVGSTSELLQDDVDALNYVQSGVSLPFMENIVSSSDAYMSSVNFSGELLSMCKQGENQVKSDDQLHEEINERLAMIRSCCKELNEDAGIAKKSSNSGVHESLQAASNSTREEHVCSIDDAPANVKDYHLMSKHGLHDHGVSHGEAVCSNADVACNVVHDVAFERANVAAEVAVGKPKPYEMARGNADVEADDMTGLQGMHMRGRAAIDDMADEYCGEVKGGGQQGLTPWQGSGLRPSEDDVVDDLANEGGQGLRWEQRLTWQGSMYVATRDDLAGDLLDDDGEAIRKGSHRDNNKMREMMYRVAAYQPIDWESIMQDVVGKERPRRRNVRISKEPQSIAARRRRERISDRIRILQRLVPGTSKLDTASMLDEAIHYLKFLKLQVQALRQVDRIFASLPLPSATTSDCPFHLAPPYPFNHSPSTPTPSHFQPFPLQI